MKHRQTGHARIRYMERNEELRQAWEFVEHTGKSIFLTGKAGTGKTTFLKTLKERSHKRMIVVTSTGVAAINAQGVTIHSFFQLPPSPYIPNASFQQRFNYTKDKRRIMRTLDLLIIDEISMVRSDTLDAIDNVLRRFREHDKPFGGVQLLMIGDLHQLTPVTTPSEEALLKQYYDTPYFFGSRALQSVDYVTIELRHVYRQQDRQFVDILNDIRDGRTTQADIDTLNARYDPTFRPKSEEGYIQLTTHNVMADRANENELRRLTTKPATYQAEVSGEFPEYSYPADKSLTIKTGAQVMFLKNDNAGRYYNGKIGRVTYADDSKVLVLCPGESEAIKVERETWENTKYTLNEKTRHIEAEVQGTFTQYPLRLAWAITIHKSQGLTFEHAIIDTERSFASGQVYVALSRCKSLEGLVLSSPISPCSIINDSRVASYVEQQSRKAQESIALLPQLKRAYYTHLQVELFVLKPVIQAESAVSRVVQEYFYSHSKLNIAHKEALHALKEEVAPIADKWIKVICDLAEEKLHEEEFQSRMKNSCRYFARQLTERLDTPLKETALLATNNKVAKKRLESALADLHDIYLTKRRLLEDTAENGFTMERYLARKQEITLDVISDSEDDATTTRKKRNDRTAKEKADSSGRTKTPKVPKVPKENTRTTSFRLFEEGKDIPSIAHERGLAESTIFGHLATYVLNGKIDASRILPADHREAIQRIISRIGTDDGAKAIKSLCPPEISYQEIQLVIDLNKNNRS